MSCVSTLNNPRLPLQMMGTSAGVLGSRAGRLRSTAHPGGRRQAASGARAARLGWPRAALALAQVCAQRHKAARSMRPHSSASNTRHRAACLPLLSLSLLSSYSQCAACLDGPHSPVSMMDCTDAPPAWFSMAAVTGMGAGRPSATPPRSGSLPPGSAAQSLSCAAQHSAGSTARVWAQCRTEHRPPASHVHEQESAPS